MTTGDRASRRWRLPPRVTLIDAAARLSQLPGLIWLDSSSRGPIQDGRPSGRYSYLSADPIDQFVAGPNDIDAWNDLRRWIERTRPEHLVNPERIANQKQVVPPGEPPHGFTGGWAGSIGYEAGAWLERTGVAAGGGLADSVMHLGLYDWVLREDHLGGGVELIVPAWSVRRDPGRFERVRRWLSKIDEQPVAPEPPSASIRRPPSSNFTGPAFRAAVAEIVERICRGDSFQVNLAQTLSAQTDQPPLRLYRRLRRRNPAPMSAYYDAGTYQILCSSPEGFLRVAGREVETRPIKGTVRRTGDATLDQALADQLLTSEKDRAENVMIVDLMRSDLSRVCTADSIEVPSLCQIEAYQFVQHLVSVVRGRLRPELNVVDLLVACFPGGSITGAPKIEAMRTIAALEPDRRGPYCGSIGYIDPAGCGGAGASEWNIAIRTMVHRDRQLRIPVGGGMTARSDPASEEAETWIKAEGMLRAL